MQMNIHSNTISTAVVPLLLLMPSGNKKQLCGSALGCPYQAAKMPCSPELPAALSPKVQESVGLVPSTTLAAIKQHIDRDLESVFSGL